MHCEAEQVCPPRPLRGWPRVPLQITHSLKAPCRMRERVSEARAARGNFFGWGVARVPPPRGGVRPGRGRRARGWAHRGGAGMPSTKRVQTPESRRGEECLFRAERASLVRIKRLASLRRYCNTPVKCAPPRCLHPPPVVRARARARARVRRVLVPDARVREAGRRARSFTSHRRAPRARACAHAFTSLSYHCAVCACPLVPG